MKIFLLFITAVLSHEREPVKNLLDGFIPDTTNVRVYTVKEIASFKRVRVGNSNPRMESEKQVMQLSGTVSRISLETDGDYHIEITDGSLKDSTAVCEVPSCFKSVHKQASVIKKGQKITVTGIKYQDKFHSPSPHRTRNFVEIHPVYKIQLPK